MFRSIALRVIIILVFAGLIGYYALPSEYQKIPGTPESFKTAKVNLGLDLQGGSQLDYKIDLRKVPEKDQDAIVEGVREVINKRVNALGVAEPNIYTSKVGDEQHLIVELAGVKDLEQAKKAVGKTIQLEFKEERAAQDPQYKNKVLGQGQATLKKAITNPAQFGIISQEEQQANPGKVVYTPPEWKHKSELTDEKIAAAVFSAPAGKILNKVLEGSAGYTFTNGQLLPIEGFFIFNIEDRRDASSLPEDKKSLQVSHILISYKGAERAPDTITRTKEEAKKAAEDIRAKLAGGADFAKEAKASSDDPGTKDSGGALSLAVNKKTESLDVAFKEGALKLSKKGELSPVVESAFGFHIIRAEDFMQTKFSQLFYSSRDDSWQETGLTGEHFVHADVSFDNLLRPIINIQFNEEGAKLFEQITERNVGKPLAIFVGGELVGDPPRVNEKISGGSAVITGRFTVEEAQAIARDLNTGAIPAPVTLSGQYTIGATLGQEALDKSLKAGVIGVIVLAVFMIAYYRLPGAIAVFALSLYTAILIFIFKAGLPLWLSLLISLVLFAAIINKVLRSHEGGWEKFISFVLACFVLFFVTFLLSSPVTLTLAGIAGVILSIGMAVDANILIFERMKEELQAGRPLSSAIDIGFDRAWSSIRDSNFSSLITCAILFYFGSSIIQGFAFNLAAGILVSMFTAITITRTLLMALMRSALGEKLSLWGPTTVPSQKTYHIVEKNKLWFGISGGVIGVALVSLLVFGLKFGLDFKGGTLMDLTFSKTVTAEDLKAELGNIQTTLEVKSSTPASDGETAVIEAEEADIGSARVVSAGQNQFIINMGHVDNETHDKILAALKAKFGEVTENRFTTIGPVVGETLKKRAVLAVVVAMIAIVLYIAFAFRKVPKRVSPWKFGICAIVALFHDVIIPIGVFSFFQFEIDALFITGILTVMGFSIHDTIVVFDRIRENLRLQERNESFTEVANKSMTQTMARSINTSLTTLLTLIALLIFGSVSLFHFVLVLVIGIAVGTYSSIFIASPLLVLWQKKDEK